MDICVERLPRGPRGEVNIEQVMREYQWRTNKWSDPADYLTAVVCLTVLEAAPAPVRLYRARRGACVRPHGGNVLCGPTCV